MKTHESKESVNKEDEEKTKPVSDEEETKEKEDEVVKKTKKSGKNMWFLGLLIIAGIAFVGSLLMISMGYLKIPAGGSADLNTPPATTTVLTEKSDLISEEGDTVKVNYIGEFKDGKIFDTSYEEIGKKADLKKTSYEPFSFVLGSGDTIKGFDNAVKGMKIGEEKTVIIPPEEGYGKKDPKLIQKVPRIQNSPRIQEVSTAKFKEVIHENPIVGKLFNSKMADFPFTVTKVNNDVVTIRYDPKEGTKIDTPFGKADVVVTETEIKIVLPQVSIGNEVVVPQGRAKIIDSNEKELTLDFNNPMAGKTLKFTIKVEDIKKKLKATATTTTIKKIKETNLSASLGREWKNIKGLSFEELKEKYKELYKFTEPYIIREGIKSIAIPSGVPEIYGKELGLEFDSDRADYMISIMRKYEGEKLNDAQMKRYIAIGKRTACEYCCGVKTLVRDDGTRACGCAHSYSMRGLAKYLILNHGDEYTNDEILAEVNKWKALYFPKQSIEKVLKARAKTGEVDLSVLQEMPNMVGGC